MAADDDTDERDDFEIDAPDDAGCIELAEWLSEMRDRDES